MKDLTIRKRVIKKNEKMMVAPSSSILHITIPRLINLSPEEESFIWDLFDQQSLAELNIYSQEWSDLKEHCIYPEDPLNNILALTLNYFGELFDQEATFERLLDSVSTLISNALGRDVLVKIDDFPLTATPMFGDLNVNIFHDLPISSSVIPKQHLAILYEHDITRWKDLFELSEYKVIHQYGLSIGAINLLNILWTIYPYAQETINNIRLLEESYPESFGDLMESWLLEIGQSERNARILIQRKAWGSGNAQTLENVAQQYRLTRERIRQLESKTVDAVIVKNSHLSSVTHPLWLAMDSLLRQSAGIISISELAAQLQYLFSWEAKPQLPGLRNLINFMPAQICAEFFYHKDSDSLVAKELPCIECSVIATFLPNVVDEKGEVAIQEVLNGLNRFCEMECASHNKPRVPFTTSGIGFFIMNDAKLKRSLRYKKGNLYTNAAWASKHGTKSSAIEHILRTANRAMHFTEVFQELRKLRPNDDSISERYTHASLSNSSQIFLWGRGTFIHGSHVQIPVVLLKQIENWITAQLEQGFPFVSVYRAFDNFHEECLSARVPTETALYSCLRATAKSLSFPHYPKIQSSKSAVDTVSYSVMIEEYVQDAGDEVSINELKSYFCDGIGLKPYMLEQRLFYIPGIIRTGQGSYIHTDNLEFDSKNNRARLRQIIDYSLGQMRKTGHVSVRKIFKEKLISCKMLGIHSPQMLYDVFRLYAYDSIDSRRYPQLALPGDEFASERNITEQVVDYVRKKNGFCSVEELEEYFVEKLGYSQQTVWGVRNSDDVFNYVKGALIHRDVIQWNDQKQVQLEEIAVEVYEDSLKSDRCYALVDSILEMPSMPPLANDIVYTSPLVADLLILKGNFVIVGNARNAYVPTLNRNNINTLEDVVYDILRREYSGSTNLREFEAALVDLGIILKRLTSSMLGNCEKVSIIGEEIMLTELV